MIVDVYIDKALPQIDQLYSYSWNDHGESLIGRRVVVPFGRGNKMEIAVVVAEREGDESKLKEVSEVMDRNPILSKGAIALGLAMRERFLTSYVQSFQPLLPKYVLGETVEVLIKEKDTARTKALMGENHKILTKELPISKESILKEAVENDEVSFSFESLDGVKAKKIPRFRAICGRDEDLTEKQKIVFDLLLKDGLLTKSEVRERTSFSDSPLNGLIKKGAAEESPEENLRGETPPELREDQIKAIADISNSEKKVHLLYGATGTGKTEVYMQLAARAMEEGKSSMIIVPEIGLATQMVHRLKIRFPGKVDILHSKRSQGEKSKSWIRLKTEPGRILVGARSAIFAPIENLGYIFIDEEQEESYDYQEGLRYDVRTVAEMRARIDGAKVVYGSATPSVAMYSRVDVDLQKHDLVGDPENAKNNLEMTVVDMREEIFRGNTDILSAEMVEGLEETLKNKKQAILFINRRGFSNFVSCRTCGYVIECDACDISMVYHRKTGRLHCHYCGRTKPYPPTCPSCGSEYLRQFGIGTEQVESWIQEHFPNARVVRMDKDTMAQKGKFDALYRAMNDGEIDILVGTQMLAKGLDFKNVDFVGVVAADLSLFVSDYRAQEKTFQLLTQVAGRAGRGDRKGKAVIQTYNPDNYSIQYAKGRHYDRFYHREMEERKQFLYPPFVRLLKIHIRGRGNVSQTAYNWMKTLEAINRHHHMNIQIGAPVEQPRIQNREHMSLTAKIFPEEYQTFLKVFKRVLMHYYRSATEKNIYVTIELDG